MDACFVDMKRQNNVRGFTWAFAGLRPENSGSAQGFVGLRLLGCC